MVKNDHKFVPSSRTIPHDDPTLLFANAGMNQVRLRLRCSVTLDSPFLTSSHSCYHTYNHKLVFIACFDSHSVVDCHFFKPNLLFRSSNPSSSGLLIRKPSLGSSVRPLIAKSVYVPGGNTMTLMMLAKTCITTRSLKCSEIGPSTTASSRSVLSKWRGTYSQTCGVLTKTGKPSSATVTYHASAVLDDF